MSNARVISRLGVSSVFDGSHHIFKVSFSLNTSEDWHASCEQSSSHLQPSTVDTMTIMETQYKITEQWHSKPKHLRVIHVGAGAAGLLMAYKMQRDFENYNLVCYEKNPDVAGTWYENRCKCSNDAHNDSSNSLSLFVESLVLIEAARSRYASRNQPPIK